MQSYFFYFTYLIFHCQIKNSNFMILRFGLGRKALFKTNISFSSKANWLETECSPSHFVGLYDKLIINRLPYYALEGTTCSQRQRVSQKSPVHPEFPDESGSRHNRPWITCALQRAFFCCLCKLDRCKSICEYQNIKYYDFIHKKRG